MQKDRTTADRADHEPPSAGPAHATGADADLVGSVRHTDSTDPLYSCNETWDADIVAEQKRGIGERIADRRDG